MKIADVLDMTVDEAVTFFRAVPKVFDPCLTLAEVGLGYVRLPPHPAARRAAGCGGLLEEELRPDEIDGWTAPKPLQ
jgi:hypothetical protein